MHGPPTCVPAAKIASGMALHESLQMLAVFKPKKAQATDVPGDVSAFGFEVGCSKVQSLDSACPDL